MAAGEKSIRAIQTFTEGSVGESEVFWTSESSVKLHKLNITEISKYWKILEDVCADHY